KLTQIRNDLLPTRTDLFSEPETPERLGKVRILSGSCLDLLPALKASYFDCLITSPPYCNRYDYTRTYALELAFLGMSEEKLSELRQGMVSCTVETRAKSDLDGKLGVEAVERARHIYNGQRLLNQILDYLEDRKEKGVLNNNGIPRMVRNYF